MTYKSICLDDYTEYEYRYPDYGITVIAENKARLQELVTKLFGMRKEAT
jgi:hypothetical protein